jgi:hypothetical protein
VEFEPGSIAAGHDGRGLRAIDPLTITVTYAMRNPYDQLPGDYVA